MKTDWTIEPPPDPSPPDPKHILEFGQNARMSISLSRPDGPNSGKLWQYFSLWAGNHTARGVDECQTHWPREAIENMRAQLDVIEAQLNQEATDE